MVSAPAPRPRHPIQLVIATIAVLFGIGLVRAALFVPPVGAIDPTVLTAYDETLTFTGALIGIDYHYRGREGAYPDPPYKGGSERDQERAGENNRQSTKRMIIYLQRHMPNGNAVYGNLRISNETSGIADEMTTLENRAYLIAATNTPKPQNLPALRNEEEEVYRVTMTWSLRFKRRLPLVEGVVGRNGIRFHQGSRPEHSRGCILLSVGKPNRLILLLQEVEEAGKRCGWW